MRVEDTLLDQTTNVSLQFFTEPSLTPPVGLVLGYNQSHCCRRRAEAFVVVSALTRRVLASRHGVRQMDKLVGNDFGGVEYALADRRRRENDFV